VDVLTRVTQQERHAPSPRVHARPPRPGDRSLGLERNRGVPVVPNGLRRQRRGRA